MPPSKLPAWAGDAGMCAALASFAILLSGPTAVITLFMAFVHLMLVGQPRVALLGVYCTLAWPYYATRKGWIGNLDETWLLGIRVSIALALAIAAFVDRFVLPYGGRVLKPTGKYATAALLVHVQRASRSADCMARVYYPTVPTKGAEKLDYLVFGGGVAQGIARFMNMPSFLLSWLGFSTKWCYDGDPTTAAPVPAAGADSGVPVPSGRLPVMVFSHGLASCPDLHGSFINELVSKGWVVIAPDHADGSAAFTAFDDGYKQLYEPLTPAQRADRSLEWKRRHDQLRHRTREISACIDLACDLAVPHTDGVPLTAKRSALPASKQLAANKPSIDSRLKVDEDGAELGWRAQAAAQAGVEGEAEKEKDDMRLLRMLLGGKLAADDGTSDTAGSGGVGVTLMGHSFGGATCLSTAEVDGRVAGVVGLDPWGFPLSAATLSRGLSHVPICALVCDAWAIWKENDVAVRLLTETDYRAKHTAPKAGEGDKGKGTAPVVAASLPIKTTNGISREGSMSPVFAVEAADRVHPATTHLILADTKHQSFTDFAVLSQHAMRFLGNIGKQPGEAQVAAIRQVITAYPAWLAQARAAAGAGGKGKAAAAATAAVPPTFVPPASVKAALVELPADRS